MWPKPDDKLYATQPDQYRSELYDRVASPLYPLAFAILTFMFLGPPQTTRQSRSLAMLALIGSSTALRLTGFFSVVAGVKQPSLLALQFIALTAAIAIGLWKIGQGKTIEHATAITKLSSTISERFARATA
jgi:lipopolysaccharide export system permease protein